VSALFAFMAPLSLYSSAVWVVDFNAKGTGRIGVPAQGKRC